MEYADDVGIALFVFALDGSTFGPVNKLAKKKLKAGKALIPWLHDADPHVQKHEDREVRREMKRGLVALFAPDSEIGRQQQEQQEKQAQQDAEYKAMLVEQMRKDDEKIQARAVAMEEWFEAKRVASEKRLEARAARLSSSVPAPDLRTPPDDLRTPPAWWRLGVAVMLIVLSAGPIFIWDVAPAVRVLAVLVLYLTAAFLIWRDRRRDRSSGAGTRGLDGTSASGHRT